MMDGDAALSVEKAFMLCFSWAYSTHIMKTTLHIYGHTYANIWYIMVNGCSIIYVKYKAVLNMFSKQPPPGLFHYWSVWPYTLQSHEKKSLRKEKLTVTADMSYNVDIYSLVRDFDSIINETNFLSGRSQTMASQSSTLSNLYDTDNYWTTCLMKPGSRCR